MKKTVLTFGLISGAIISVLMGGSLLLADKIGSGHSMALGYTIMVASFLAGGPHLSPESRGAPLLALFEKWPAASSVTALQFSRHIAKTFSPLFSLMCGKT